LTLTTTASFKSEDVDGRSEGGGETDGMVDAAEVVADAEWVWSNYSALIAGALFFVLSLSYQRIRRFFRRISKSKKKPLEIPIPQKYPIKSFKSGKKTVISQNYAHRFMRNSAIGTGLIAAFIATDIITTAAILLSTGPVTFPSADFYAAGIVMEIVGFVFIYTAGDKMVTTPEGRMALGQLLAWGGRKPNKSGKESKAVERDVAKMEVTVSDAEEPDI
jgi:hypothetical protein